jgi:hypothetical protein
MKNGVIPEGDFCPDAYGTRAPPEYLPEDSCGVPLPFMVLPPLFDFGLVRPPLLRLLDERPKLPPWPPPPLWRRN